MKSRAKGNSPLVRVDLDITKDFIKVGGNDDIDGFNGSRERLIKVLLLYLKLKERTINLVDDHDWLYSFTKSLTEDSLGLDTDPFNTVDYDKGAISDT